eukprot:TRINITY_DN6292_c0_g1_i2.p1 TRINITY_DN6292_c0_g1~~TRINITY_DN6292_c0_g1_i2.p1  ORF type:complete len:665 (+),score=130.15 TRINITY_DN6292_c0_g1_i2:18-2012(+)
MHQRTGSSGNGVLLHHAQAQQHGQSSLRVPMAIPHARSAPSLSDPSVQDKWDFDEGGDESNIEEASVFTLLLPGLQKEGVTRQEQDRANDDYEEYLLSLATASLELLAKEPDILGEKAKQIKREMQDLAFTNYKSFIDTSQCLRDMKDQMKHGRYTVSNLLEHLPQLSNACSEFCTGAGGNIAVRRAAAQRALDHHAGLLDLLEIPELMLTFVRSELYDEALQLDAFTAGLRLKHPDISIIQQIADDVRASSEMMLGQLHAKLKDNIQLPVCLRVISHLRRLRVYNETELRMSFLKSRDAWLQSMIDAAVANANPTGYLSKHVDVCRIHLFDIVTQYRAIFSDDTATQEEHKDAGILYSWLVQKVSEFLTILRMKLPEIKEGTAIANILDQCMYYGMSLGRVGVDFRALLPPVFEKTINSMFTTMICDATREFCANLSHQKWIAPPKALSAAMMGGLDTVETIAHAPPMLLLDYPSLAIYTNSLLTALNELRQCVPYSLRQSATSRLREEMMTAMGYFRTVHEELSLDENQQKYFEATCKIAGEVFLPYIIRCFSAVFDNNATPLIDVQSIAELVREFYDKDIGNSADGDGGEGQSALYDLLLDSSPPPEPETEAPNTTRTSSSDNDTSYSTTNGNSETPQQQQQHEHDGTNGTDAVPQQQQQT